MKVLIISPGKKHSSELADAIAEYQKRLSPNLPIQWEFPAIGTKESEGTAILKRIEPQDLVVLLDERGKEVDSPGFASVIDDTLNASTKRIVFIIGGAFGVSDGVMERANMTLRLSRMVFPHMIARLLLVEQLYRAWSIRSGGKYHHA